VTLSRRQLVGRAMDLATVAAVGLLAPEAWAQGSAEACYDPAKLAFTQKSRRRALGYIEASNDPARRCGGCAFFTGTTAGCGTCQMLSAGPVDAAGVCNSFASKGAK